MQISLSTAGLSYNFMFLGRLVIIPLIIITHVILFSNKIFVNLRMRLVWLPPNRILRFLFLSISKIKHFRKQLLLDSNWGLKASSWIILAGEKAFYEDMLSYFGSSSLPCIINVFSTFGEREFLPKGIKWVVKFINEEPKNAKYLESKSSVMLIKKLFNNHISTIKEDQNLVADFMFILNKMVENGSCEAYLIRECVIVYKSNMLESA